MKKYAAVLSGVVVLSVVALAVGSWGGGQDLDDSDLGILPSGSTYGDLSSERVTTAAGGVAAAAADPNTIVYLFPRDTDSTATVIILINTTNRTSAKGRFRVYDSDGQYQHGWWFTLGAGNLHRVCTDDVPYLNWWKWNVGAYLNAYAQLELPPGVVADGYVVWNNGPSYDYNVEAHTIPLRFMSEPVR